MNLYALVDEDIQIPRHKGKLAIFTDIEMLKRHAWRYTRADEKYKIAELEIEQIYDMEDE